MSEPRTAGELSITRVESFGDGIFAFSVTLLVLTLSVPDVADAVGGVNLRMALGAEWPRFAVYLISFLMVGQVWIGHHFIFSNFRRADHWLVWLNIFFLATIAILPFTTALLGHYASHTHDRVVAAFVYGAFWTIGGLFLSGSFWYASAGGRLLHPGYDLRLIPRLRVVSAVGPTAYMVFTLLALVSFWLSVAGFAFVPMFYIFQGLRPPPSAHGVT